MNESTAGMTTPSPNRGWFNRNVFAFGLTSFLSDFCHEMATAVLPQFMQAIGASVAALGFIEGIADALSSFVKLGAGYHSDKIGHRKAWTVVGYALTAVAKGAFAFAFTWPLILIGRIIGWLGRGIRGPLRDAMLADCVAPAHRGKAFGFHRAGDTAGAVVGPLVAFAILSLMAQHPEISSTFAAFFPSLAAAPGAQFRLIFLLTLIPGLLSVASIAFLVTEEGRQRNQIPRLWNVLGSLPRSYRSFLVAVGLFGLADFAPTLMILRATTSLQAHWGMMDAARWAAALYVLRNIVYAAASYPIGALSDKFPRTQYLAVGYGVAVITFLGFAFAVPSIAWFAIMFGLAGVFIAWEDTVEGVAVRDYVGPEVSGTAYGILGVVNGIGDFASSLIVGLLWTATGPTLAFSYSAVLGLAGVVLMTRTRSAAQVARGRRS